MHFVKTSRFLAVLVLFFSWSLLVAQTMVSHPAGGRALVPTPLTTHYGSCVLEDHFQPVHHTGRRHVLQLFAPLALANGFDPESYSIDLITDRRGVEEINAMTCSGSQMIWLSVKAYTELSGNEVALSYVLAHEMAHGEEVTNPVQLATNWMTTNNLALYESLTNRQRIEILTDIRSAELLLAAGFLPEQIVAGASYILSRDGAAHLLSATVTHPGGWDRITFLERYLSYHYAGGGALYTVGRVMPRNSVFSR